MTVRDAWAAADAPRRWKAVGEVLVSLIAIGGLVTGIWGLVLQRGVASAEAASDATEISFTAKELRDQGEGHYAPQLELKVSNGSKRPIKEGYIFLEVTVDKSVSTRRLSIGKMGGCQQRTYTTTDLNVPYAGVRSSTFIWRDAVGTSWAILNNEGASEIDRLPSYDGLFSAVDSATVPFGGGSCKPK